MPRIFRAMPTFNGVGAGQTATVNLPIGNTYYSLLLELGGTTFEASHIDEMRVKGNGRTIQTVAGADLNVINQFDRRAASVDHLVLDFERYGLITRGGREVTAIGTGALKNTNRESPNYNPVPLTTLQIEADIAGTAVAPTLSAKAHQGPPLPLGVIRHRRKFTYSPAGAGDFEISDLPKGLLIDKVFFKSASDRINGVKLDRDGFRLFDRTDAQNDVIQSDGVRTPQASWFVYDPTEEGHAAESLVTAGVQDLRFILDMAGADTLTVYVDYIGGFAG